MSQAALDLAGTAAAVRAGRTTATRRLQEALDQIRARDGGVGAVTRLLDQNARHDASRVDASIAAGIDPGPLAGVPFGVKDLFDVQGLPTTGGAAMRLRAPAAVRDAEAIRRLKAAGAVLVATLNMDALAYGFVTDNAHYGVTRNPHDLARFAGGSSGGSAAAVAAGMLPLTLGSDTNGSIRVPAALCGIYGFRPAHGGAPMAGVLPFAHSLDDIGPFTGSIADLKLAVEVISGASLGEVDAAGVRVARLGGWFARNLTPTLSSALDQVARRLDAGEVDLPEVARARSAAFLITAAEGGAYHLDALRRSPMAFDPAVRDRLIAGALMPASAYVAAQGFRAWFHAEVEAVFQRFDVLIAPSVGGPAPRIDHPFIEVDGELQPARSQLGLFTQPISCVGLPVIAAPLALAGLPLGLQLIGWPGREAALFALAGSLESDGLVGARVQAPAAAPNP